MKKRRKTRIAEIAACGAEIEMNNVRTRRGD